MCTFFNARLLCNISIISIGTHACTHELHLNTQQYTNICQLFKGIYIDHSLELTRRKHFKDINSFHETACAKAIIIMFYYD